MPQRFIKRIRGFDLVYGKIQKQWDKKLEKRRLEQHSKKFSTSRFLRRSERDDDSMFTVYYQ